MKKIQHLILLSFLLLSTYCIQGQNLKTKLENLFPEATITSINNLSGYSESFQLILKQPLDHQHPEKGTFDHYIYLSHLDYNKPMVIETHGYDTRNIKSEVSQLLNTNQVAVEYRFYGQSRPNPIPWEYLTNDQASADYHAIAVKLKELYKGIWISTGISKGGETALIYKSKYPNDVSISVPYVAPIINTLEDTRTNDRINTNGTASCRAKIVEFQRAILQNRAAIMTQFRNYATYYGITYNEVSMDEALEYSVLEFPFSFWQWGHSCSAIPSKTASATTLFNYLNQVAGVDFYGDYQYEKYLPSFYQHMAELGYYGFDFTPVKDLLTVVTSTSNNRFAPKNTPAYNPNYIKEVRNYLETKGEKIMYIHGGLDPWGACLVNPNTSLDYKIMTLTGGSHGTRIGSFPSSDQTMMITTLNRWLNEATLGVTNPALEHSEILIYSPEKDGLYTLKTNKPNQSYTVKVFNALGQLVLEKNKSEQATTSIDLRDKQSGMYLFKIKFTANGTEIVKKVIR
ncbi:S28 family serine protease [Flavobacterium crassostreae]|uniref:S28 family serine protease n=1 Tax=Flavobacterium crassostreae TaxID=1763534 RepID=UPI0008358C75|nr:S28 family serine protease [Flavobacterium crassostreae]